MSPIVAKRSGIWGAIALALCLTTCGDDKPFECTKPADCVGKPAGNDCKVVGGKGRCVFLCLPATSGSDGCPPTAHCTGTADDNSTFCAY
jgi:hypothetical protein